MNERILCVWLPNWPVQRVMAAEPALVSSALVLQARDPRRGLLVAAASLAARRSGARVGMRMSELAALTSANTQTAWEVRPYAPEEDLEALCLLAEEAQQFSPLVGLEQHDEIAWCGRSSCQPQSLYLDVGGVANLFGGEEALIAEVAQWLANKRHFAYMAIASNIGAAWAMANYEISSRIKRACADSNLVETKPPPAPATVLGAVPDCRWLVTEMWEEAELLACLPVAALRVDDQTVNKLRRLGVHQLSGLWQLPRDGLASRLGEQLIKRSDQALGQAAESIVALHGQPDWTTEFSFEYPTLDLELLKGSLLELCRLLAGRLSNGGQGALRCLCRLDLVRKPPLVMNLGLYRPTCDADHLHGLLVGQLEQLLLKQTDTSETTRTVRPSKAVLSRQQPKRTAGPLAVDEEGHVWRLTLQATLIGPILWQQTQMFDQSDARHKQQLAHLIDTLSGRLGRSRVIEAHLERDAEPEQAVSYRPLTGRRNDGTQQQTLRKLNSRLASSGAEPRPTDPLRRPTALLTPAERLQGITTDSDGQLVEFVYENNRLQVAYHWGPERLESGWWRGPSIRRDYYRVETAGGAQWWVYREVTTGAWFLHGIFG